MTTLFANNADTELASAISSVQTVISVLDASEFPVGVSPTDPIWVTLADSDNTLVEITKCTGISGNNLTVVRGQDGSTAIAHPAGTAVEARLVREVFTEIQNDVVGKADLASDNSFTAANQFLGTFDVGDPGTEAGSIQVNGSTFPAVAKVNRFGSGVVGELVLHRHSDTDDSHLVFSRALSNDATHVDVINGTSLGDMVFTGWAVDSYWQAAIIRAIVDTGTVGSASMPTRINFLTSPDGSAAPLLRMSIRAGGIVEIAGEMTVGGGAINTTSIGNWNTAFGWGDHAAAGYLSSALPDQNFFLGSQAGQATPTPISDYFVIQNGFENRVDSVISFDEPTRTFTIAPTGSSYRFWSNNKLFIKTGPDQIVIPDDDSLHYIYFDGNSLLQSTINFIDEIITEFAFVCVIDWDVASQEAVLIGEERHGREMSSATHLYNHHTTHARYDSGFAPANLDIDGTGDLDSNAQFSIGNGIFWDEDIRNIIADGLPQDLDPIAQLPILHRVGSSGHWQKSVAGNFPVLTTGTGRLAWNEDVAGTWQQTEVDNLDFVLCHVLATNDIRHPLMAIQGQAEYDNLGAARDGANDEINNLALGESNVLFPEFLFVATFIYQTSNGYANGVKGRIRSTAEGLPYVDWRGQLITAGAGAGITTHNQLAGLDQDDHPQYHNDVRGDIRYYTQAQVDGALGAKENALGNPSTDGYVLSSTVAGVRSWIPPGGGWVNAGTLATTSGTSVTFSGIPSWATKLTLLFNGCSVNGADHWKVQLGTSGGIVSTGYISTSVFTEAGSSVSTQNKTNSMVVYGGNSARTLTGSMVLVNTDGNSWVASHTGKLATDVGVHGAGSVDVGGTVTQLRIESDLSNTLDAGEVTLFYE